MARRWPGQSLPAPKQLAPPEIVKERLQPHLLLFSDELPFDPAAAKAPRRSYEAAPIGPHRVPLARVSWRYGPISLPAGGHFQQGRVMQRGGKLLKLMRDRAAEEQAAERIGHSGLLRVTSSNYLPANHPNAHDLTFLDPDLWLEFVLADVPDLRSEGWLVEIAENFPLRLAVPSGDLSFDLTEGSGIDWFDLNLGVMVDGERISLVPALLDFVADAGVAVLESLGTDSDDRELPLLLPLPDGRMLTIPMAQLRPILGPLLELFVGAEADRDSGTLRLSRRDAADLALLEAASAEGVVWSGGDAIRALGRQLRDHGGIQPCAPPEGFRAVLRSYQQHGLAWLQFLRTAGLGGILADDMGLGKTVQALAHLAVEQANQRTDLPSLVICPTSLVPNWMAETQRFAPSLRCLVLHGPGRAAHFPAIGAHDLVITTYPLLARDHAVLEAQDWHVVMLDEAQTIKNPLATTSKLARTLRARQRLCLSGTPLENHLGELWSLFDFLLPGFLGDRKQFGTRYRGPIEKAGNEERQALLSQRIAPFLLRRTKEEVAADLPPKTEITETVEMAEAQHGLYEGIRLAMHAKVRAAIEKRGIAGSGIIILDALLKLRQACCDPRLVKLTTAKKGNATSAKLERLLELLPQMLEEGRRVLLFSQFTSMLALIEAELTQRDIPYVLLTGDTKDRIVPIRQFQSGEVPLFLISLKAGGVGLNLTAADTVIHYDPWWNPAVENQATDRAHRLGQTQSVWVVKLVAQGTIEERILALQERKAALAESMYSGAQGRKQPLFTESDLQELLKPLGA
jgi:superfamily II DNA or RNA helicase